VSKVLFPLPKPPDYECDHPNLHWIPCREKRRHHIPCLIFTQRKARFLLIYVHGNACDLGSVYNEVRYVSDFLGVHLIAMELRGYGLSQGSPSEKSINEDLAELYEFLTSVLGFPPERIIFFGRSIGTGPTSRLVSRLNRRGVECAGLILQSPYTSILNVSRHLAGMAADLVVAERWKNIDEVRHVRSPLLVIHGKLDTLIPYQMATDLYNTCPSKRKVLVLPENADHNTFNLYNDILRPVASFIRNHCHAAAREIAWTKLTLKRNKTQKDDTKKKEASDSGGGKEPPIEPTGPESMDVEPHVLKLPKFLQYVPFYAWEQHPDCKAIMSRLKAARLAHNVKPVRRNLPTATPTITESVSRVGSRTSGRATNKLPFTTASPSLNTSDIKSTIVEKNLEEQTLTEWEKTIKTLEDALLGVQRSCTVGKHTLKQVVPGIPVMQQQKSPQESVSGNKSNGKRSGTKKRVLGDIEVLSLVEALESMMLCGLEHKTANLEPPSFWPVVVDAARASSKLYDDLSSEFGTDVRFIASQDLRRSDVHCMLGRAWLKHLLTNDRLHKSLELLTALPAPKNNTELLIGKWYGAEAALGRNEREIKEKIMAMALSIDDIPMSLQLD